MDMIIYLFKVYTQLIYIYISIFGLDLPHSHNDLVTECLIEWMSKNEFND